MSTERSDRIYEVYQEASTKFDYFVAGVALALVGYLGARAQVATLGINGPTIEVAAVVALLAASYCGLKRIELGVTLLGVMHRRLYEEEAAGSLTSASRQGGALLNEATGAILSPSDILARIYGHKVGVQAARETLDELVKKGGAWYRWRNRLLGLGLLALIASRVVTAVGL